METVLNPECGRRYFFHEQRPGDNIKIYRADFVSKISTGTEDYIKINNCETEFSPRTYVFIPFGWIKKIETLENVIQSTPLNSDIILEIDGYF